MEKDGYRRRMAEGPFRNPREKEMYDVTYKDWRSYRAQHPDYFPRYHEYTLQDLAGERNQKKITVEGGEQYNFILWQGSVCDLEVDAVINAANGSLLGGGGVDGAIHDAAGPLITRECADKYDEVDTCGTVLTKGYRLPAHFVIHTVGPVYYHEQGLAQQKLELCYYRSFELCEKHELSSLGLCCISCGIYGYPPEKAGKVAISTALNWCKAGNRFPRTFVFVTFTERENAAYYQAFRELVIVGDDVLPRLPRPQDETKSEDGDQQILQVSHSVLATMPSSESDLMSSPKIEAMQVERPPESKTQIEKESESPQYATWAEVPIQQWSEFKKQNSGQFDLQKAAKVTDLSSVSLLSKTVSSSDSPIFHVVQLDLAVLAVSCIVTLPCESLYAAAGDEIRADLERLERSGNAAVLKGYRLQADYVVLAKEGNTEADSGKETLAVTYRDSLEACDKLLAESVAFTPLAEGSVSEAFIALREAVKWLKKTESRLRTFVFVVRSEAEGATYSQELRNAIE